MIFFSIKRKYQNNKANVYDYAVFFIICLLVEGRQPCFPLLEPYCGGGGGGDGGGG